MFVNENNYVMRNFVFFDSFTSGVGLKRKTWVGQCTACDENEKCLFIFLWGGGWGGCVRGDVIYKTKEQEMGDVRLFQLGHVFGNIK